MKLGVCIPCYDLHIQYLPYCLKSIEAQTRKPTIVSISVSSSKNKTPINPSDYSFPIVYTVTEAKLCAGTNRNVAAEAIYNQVEILSFFDADDIMHPRRLELLETHFTKYALDSCVHYFMKGSVKHRLAIQDIVWPSVSNSVYTTPFETGRDNVAGRVWYVNPNKEKELGHCGHYTLKSSVWRRSPCVENWGKGQDSEHVWRVYKTHAKHAYIPDTLSMYITD